MNEEKFIGGIADKNRTQGGSNFIHKEKFRGGIADNGHDTGITGASSLRPLLKINGGWDSSPIVIEEYKLIFFTTPKVGTTVFKKLFRRMMGLSDWQNENENLPHNPRFNGLNYLFDYSTRRAWEIWNSPNWTRAIFVRDPKERLLSAYLDKAVGHNGNYVKRQCCHFHKKQIDHSGQKMIEHFQKYQGRTSKPRRQNGALGSLGKKFEQARKKFVSEYTESLEASSRHGRRVLNTREMNAFHSPASLVGMEAAAKSAGRTVPIKRRGMEYPKSCENFTAPEFVLSFETFVKEFMQSCKDPHWAPQSERVDDEIWKKINFVGSFRQIEIDTRRLLEQIGAWKTFGAYGWSGTSIFAKNNERHKTSADKKSKSYYAPELEQLAYRFYHTDYEHKMMAVEIPHNLSSDQTAGNRRVKK